MVFHKIYGSKRGFHLFCKKMEENSYCLVFHHPSSHEITMLPRAPKPPEKWKWRYAKRIMAILVKYVI